MNIINKKCVSTIIGGISGNVTYNGKTINIPRVSRFEMIDGKVLSTASLSSSITRPTAQSSRYSKRAFPRRSSTNSLATQSWSPASIMCSARCSSTIPTNRKDMCSSHSSKLKTSTMSQLYIFAT